MAHLTRQLAGEIIKQIECGRIRQKELEDFEQLGVPVLEVLSPDPDLYGKLEVVFKGLLKFLPERLVTLFCILDGLSECENDTQQALFTALSPIARYCHPSLHVRNFKLLMTAGTGFSLPEGYNHLTLKLAVPRNLSLHALEVNWNETVDKELDENYTL